MTGKNDLFCHFKAAKGIHLSYVILGKALGGHSEMLLAVREGGRWAVQACPLHGCSCVWKPSSEPSPDV